MDHTRQPVIQVEDLDHVFEGTQKRESVQALTSVSMSVEPGEFVAIIGPSGCGKTTLFNVIAGLNECQTGVVTVDGAPPKVGNPNVGYLFARDSLLPWRTAQSNVELSLKLRGVSGSARRTRAREILEQVGLGASVGALPAELSQGMRQRVAIARTLATEPGILLMDEPFSALDAQTRLVVQEVFIQLWQRLQATVILITHDLGEAVALADTVFVMSRSPGKVKRRYAIDIPRPRSIADIQSDPRFHELYAEIWSTLRDEFYASA